ncbi:glycosyl hydrolase [Modestobacter sp. VKM Ac-2986]|uniref:glycosyl hydrolase n=1 Tax=Modestobacter sp. VKM Ac-2986 TaxID=3004140 RepID=UPI0022AB5647|nr:glycosyl hydrolase [Modestobacter sp. VKM Ac-2986]MCZ2830421.1 glycosyl hydrolase [Modestobacter sp. VKM Ac-2986]
MAPRLRAALLAAATVLVGAGSVLLAPPAGAAACAPDPVLCPERVHVGASVAGLPRDPGALDAFTAATGVSPSSATFFLDFGGQVDTGALQRLSAGGRLPMLTWEPWTHTRPGENPYSLTAIAAGEFDGYLRAQGAALAAVGAPVAVRFGHEMNGSWYPWGQGVNGNTPEDYVAAYRHVVEVVSAAGADDVIWTWSPITVISRPNVPLAPLYPGDDVVDWVGLSVYFSSPVATYAADVPPTLRQLDQIAPTKPIYVAESAVLPGPDRPAMIHDLVSGLLTIPRLVGFTWFDQDTQHDYRIENDPPAAAQLAAELSSPWFGGAGQVDDPVVAAPLVLTPPTLSGTAQVGAPLTATPGTWRASDASGALTTGLRWHRCTDPRAVTSCTPTASTGTTHTPDPADLGRYLRVAETATNDVGSTVAWSRPTVAVLMTPAAPAAPAVESRDGALRLTFPPAPTGTTHWQVSVDGAVRPLVPVADGTYWITGLTNGVSHRMELAAASASTTGQLVSAPTAGTAVPMTSPWTPFTTHSAGTLTVRLPASAPPGATGWHLTVGATTRTLPLGTTSADVPADPGTPWALRATAGDWGGPNLSLPATGTVPTAAAPATPAAPAVESRDGALRLTFPSPPAGTTHWQLTVDGVTRPLVPVATTTYWVTGLTNGSSHRLGLAAATVSGTATTSTTAIGTATTGTAVPMTTPWTPFTTHAAGTLTVRLPASAPAGATGWHLTVGTGTRTLPLGTATVDVAATPGTPWALRATAGDWGGPNLSLPATGSVPTAAAPATPAAPAVESRDGALRLTFPAAPAGTTHWQLTVDGATRPLVPVATGTYWVTGLTNGSSHRLGLAAATVTGTATTSTTAIGTATTGTAVPMTTPWTPFTLYSGGTLTVRLPTQAPAGATGWLLTVGTTTRTLPLGSTSTDVPAGPGTAWALRATAGDWNGPNLSLPATGTVR